MPDPFGVIFDVDGVLVDSYEAHYESWRRVAEQRGLTITPAQFAMTFGRTSREIIAELWRDAVLSAEDVVEIDRWKEEDYRRLVAERFPAMDGAAELIRSLSAAGIAVAVGSSGPPENVRLALDRLGVMEFVQVQITGRDVQRGKPDPQVFLLAAERLGLPPAACAVIEDAPAGIEAANRAGMLSVGFVSTGHTSEQLSAAYYQIHSLRELSVSFLTMKIAERRRP